MRKYAWTAAILALILVLVGANWYIGHVNSTHPAIWPMYGGDPGHRFQAKTALPISEPKVLWTYPIKGPGLPVVGPDGTIYLNQNDELHAISADGERKWVAKGTGTIISLAMGRQGQIYVRDQAGLRAHDAQGQILWSVPMETREVSPLVVGQGGVIYNMDGRRLLALTDAGKEKWTFEFPRGISNPPIETPDGLIIYGVDDTIYALDRNGAVAWQQPIEIGSRFAAAPDGSIYVQSSPGGSGVLVGEDGELVQQKRLGNGFNNVAVGKDFIQEGPVRLDAQLRPLWGTEGGPREHFLPVVDQQGTVLMLNNANVGSPNAVNRLYGLNNQGERIWELKDMAVFSMAIPLADGRIIFCTRLPGGEFALVAAGDR